jgi:hypothetical protein
MSRATVILHQAEQRQLYLKPDADLLLIGIASWLVVDKAPAVIQEGLHRNSNPDR